jgi:hypothetical protein
MGRVFGRFGLARGVLAAAALAPLAAQAGEAASPGSQFLPMIAASSTIPGNGDLNPYGIAFVPEGFPQVGTKGIQAGDVLVTNFNNSGGTQGMGSTIIRLTPTLTERTPPKEEPNSVNGPGTAEVFFQAVSEVGFTAALGVLKHGFVIAGSTPTTDGQADTLGAGQIFFFDNSGNDITSSVTGLSLITPTTITNGPWDLTIADSGSKASIFVSNLGAAGGISGSGTTGFVARIDLTVGTPTSATPLAITNALVLATGFTVTPNSGAPSLPLVLGPTGLVYDGADDRLFVASTADNKIFIIPSARSAKGTISPSSIKPVPLDAAAVLNLRGPLGMAVAPNNHLLMANGDAVNGDAGHPSEIVEIAKNGKFVNQYNVDPSQGAAFGLASSPLPKARHGFATLDDVTNSVTVYTFQ